MAKTFPYGGQAVLEGVMIRGQRNMTVAVRRPSGEVAILSQPLPRISTGSIREAPLIRGLFALGETLILGVRALLYSANISLDQEEDISPATAWAMLAFALGFVVVLFFLIPVLLMHWLDPYIGSPFISNLVEGILRLGLFVIYLKAITLMPDIRTVFAYHGAEHKTVNAYEDGAVMDVEVVQRYSTAHARCGTGFLLVVLVVAIVVFTLLGRPPIWLRLLSRIALLPVIVSIGYEVMRFAAAHIKNNLVRAILTPSLALQALTTREPNSQQLEIAIAALRAVLQADALEKEASTLERSKSYSRYGTPDQ